MGGKIYTVKPTTAFSNQSISLPKGREQAEKGDLKESLVDYLERGLLLGLLVLFLVLSVFLARKVYQYFLYHAEKRRLAEENRVLTSEISRLTSKEALEEKAKKLGLRPPKPQEIIRLP